MIRILVLTSFLSFSAISAPKEEQKTTLHTITCSITEMSRRWLRESDDEPATEKDLDDEKVEKYWQFYSYKATVKFKVQNLFSKSAKDVGLIAYSDKNEEEPIYAKAEGKEYSVFGNFNGQGGDLRVGRTSLSLVGDDDGVTWSILRLTKASGYTEGKVTTSDRSHPDRFEWADDKVTCTVVEKK